VGVYNEVFKKCPYCKNGTGYTQVGPIACERERHECSLFNLDDIETLAARLDETGLRNLHDRVQNEWFVCGGAGFDSASCGRSFMLGDAMEARRRLAAELFQAGTALEQ